MGSVHDLENTFLAIWWAVHAINNDRTFLGYRYLIRTMRKNGLGSNINISFYSRIVCIPKATADFASKVAVRIYKTGHTLPCGAGACDLLQLDTHSGVIMTPMWEPLSRKDQDQAERGLRYADTPMRCFGQAEEAVMLASEEATYRRDVELIIDGVILAGAATKL